MKARTPDEAYRKHKSSAKQRGIEFDLTFEQWWILWREYWPLRHKFVMARTGDAGAYTWHNVRIATHAENWAEAHGGWPKEGENKECRACARVLPISHFAKRSTGTTHVSYCHECRLSRARDTHAAKKDAAHKSGAEMSFCETTNALRRHLPPPGRVAGGGRSAGPATPGRVQGPSADDPAVAGGALMAAVLTSPPVKQRRRRTNEQQREQKRKGSST